MNIKQKDRLRKTIGEIRSATDTDYSNFSNPNDFVFNFSSLHLIEVQFFFIAENGCTYEYSPPVEPFVRGLWGVSLRKCFVQRSLSFSFFYTFN